MDSSVPMELWSTPEVMPQALLATIPPILAALTEAGSGPIFFPQGRQGRVRLGAQDGRAQADGAAVGADFDVAEALHPQQQENRVGKGLARQGCAGGPEGEGKLQAAASGQGLQYLGFVFDPHDEFGDQTVDRWHRWA